MTSAQTELRLLALLLDYPDEQLLAGRDEVARGARRPRSLAVPRRAAGVRDVAVRDRALHDRAGVRRELRLQQAHDALPELLHVRRPAPARDGDARAQGALRGDAGLPFVEGNLPDYLPAVLEFAALAPAADGDELLRQMRAGHRDHPRRAAPLRQPLRAAARRARRRHAEAQPRAARRAGEARRRGTPDRGGRARAVRAAGVHARAGLGTGLGRRGRAPRRCRPARARR